MQQIMKRMLLLRKRGENPDQLGILRHCTFLKHLLVMAFSENDLKHRWLAHFFQKKNKLQKCNFCLSDKTV